ncbi:MAG: hypothetical protein H7Z14_12750 [Anaerolineae bacterium]|nr:hypothetical protein [Phycisphaerae bacterium]
MAGFSLRGTSVVLLLTTFTFAEPATTTAPSTAPAANVIKVKRGDLEQKIVTTGTFEPVDPVEIRIRPKSYFGELLIVKAIAPGAAVGKGENVLELDQTWINRQLASAENDRTSAKATYDKAQADMKLGDEADALALKLQQEELKNAQNGLSWWEKVDGKHILQNAELAMQAARDSVEDQQDELDQLKKMYKSEELTNATADIVVKRALRSLKRSQIGAEMAEARVEKIKQNDWDVYHSKFVNNVDQQKQALDRLIVQQQQAKIMRQAGLTGAKLGLDGAEEKLSNLKGDLEFFSIKSPESLTYFYGQLLNGSWQNNNPRALRTGERIALQPPQAPPAVQMTGFVPGKLKLVADIPESKALQVEPGLKARVIPTAQSYTLLEGTTGPRSPVPSQGGSSYSMPIELPTFPAKIEPGMKASITIEAPKAANVLVVPTSAVKDLKVWKHASDGTDKSVEVITGRTDGEMVEIVSGLSDGDEILKDGKK